MGSSYTCLRGFWRTEGVEKVGVTVRLRSSPAAMAFLAAPLRNLRAAPDVVEMIAEFLTPLPPGPPALLERCPPQFLHRLLRVRLYRVDEFTAELADGAPYLIQYWDTREVGPASYLPMWDLDDPFFARWREWHGRNWPRIGLFLMDLPELEREHLCLWTELLTHRERTDDDLLGLINDVSSRFNALRRRG